MKKIVKSISVFFLIIVILLSALFTFSLIDRKKGLSVFPHDYSIYVHTDSIWDAVEPFLDLKAVDLFLTTPELATVRGLFMQLRSSDLRKSKILSLLASKKIDAAVYDMGDERINFIGCVDFGGFSFVTRFSSLYISALKIKNLYKEDNYYVIKNEEFNLFIKPYKNLVIISDNYGLLQKAMNGNYDNYTKQDYEILNKKTDDAFKVFANARKFVKNTTENEGLLEKIKKVIPENSLTSVSFKITDEQIKLKADIPFNLDGLKDEDDLSFKKIIERKSTIPALLSRFRENVQYYTIINAGSLSELKDAFFPLFVKDSENSWKKYNSLSKSFLKVTLEELLFSWSGEEIAVFGIENKNDPVFALKIEDEKKRQDVFKKFLSSMLIKDNSRLVLDEVRIPRLEFPYFLQELLGLFEISLPNPYYLIQDEYVYFSENAENLLEIRKSSENMAKISSDVNWNEVSKELSMESTVSLFYNLERSVPFFLKSKAVVSNLLSLYSRGRADLEINDGKFVVQLSAISKAEESDDLNVIPGFPVVLEGRCDGDLQIFSEKNNSKSKNTLYWIEDKNTVSMMELPSTKISRKKMNDEVFICTEKSENENDAGLWCVTKHGAVYSLDDKLDTVKKFPVLLDAEISVKPVAVRNGLYVTTDSGKIYFINRKAEVKEIEIELFGNIKSPLNILEDKKGNNIIALYDKSFMGRVVFYKEGKITEFEIPEISFGSPVFMDEKKNDKIEAGFVTQSGTFISWNIDEGKKFEINLEGTYKTGAVSMNGYYYAVSVEGKISRIDRDGNVIYKDVTGYSCNEPFVSVYENKLFVCPDGNVIFAFDENLENVDNYPVTGWGNPVFADVNGDKARDLFTLSVDNKLYARKIK